MLCAAVLLLGLALKLSRWCTPVIRPTRHCQDGLVARFAVNPADHASKAAGIAERGLKAAVDPPRGRQSVHGATTTAVASDAWILSQSATSLAKAIRDGQLTSRQCCEAQLRWARLVDIETNAVANWRAQQALAEADAADSLIRASFCREGSAPADELGPFFGVGCSVKECIGITGMPQTAGLVARAEGSTGLPESSDIIGPVLAVADATVVSRLRFHADAVAPTPLLGTNPSSKNVARPVTAASGPDFGSPSGRWMLSGVGLACDESPVDQKVTSFDDKTEPLVPRGVSPTLDLPDTLREPHIEASLASRAVRSFTAAYDDADDRDASRMHGGWYMPENGSASAGVEALPASTSSAAILPSGTGAGLIPLWNTNLSELCMWYESSNAVYGRSCNPYDLSRTVGGSSGGEGAMVASAAAPVGVGSDVGGSIRIPAAFNGVFGHKPTGGLVPNSGQYPFSTSRILATGPIARYALDLWPMLCVMAGHDADRDIACRGVPMSVFGLIGSPTLLRHVSPGAPPGVAFTRTRDVSASLDAFQQGVAIQHGPGDAAARRVHVLLPAGTDTAPEPGEPWSSYHARTGAKTEAQLAKLHGREQPEGRRTFAALTGSTSASSSDEDEATSRGLRRSSSTKRRRPIARTPALQPSTAELRGRLSHALGSDVQVGFTESLRAGAAWERYSRLRSPIAAASSTSRWGDVTVFVVPQVSTAPPLLSSSCLFGPDGMLSAQAATVHALCNGLGCKGPVNLDVPELPQAFDMWSAALQEDGPTPFASFLANGHPDRTSQLPALRLLLCKLACLPCVACATPRRLIRHPGDPATSSHMFSNSAGSVCVGRSCFACGRYTAPALGLGAIEHLPGLLAPRAQHAAAIAAVALRHRLTAVLAAGKGILVFPPHPVAAPPHCVSVAEFFNTAFTSLFNALTLPVTSIPVTLVPVGKSSTMDDALAHFEAATPPAVKCAAAVAAADACVPATTLPLGMQLVGAPGHDRLTIAAAEALDRTVLRFSPGTDPALAHTGACAARFGWRPPPACLDAGIMPAYEGLHAFSSAKEDA